MNKVYYNDVINFKGIDLEDKASVFDTILEDRKAGLDAKRFFLNYISPEELEQFDFSNLDSLRAFRRKCLTINDPLVHMGGCNMHPDCVDRGLRYSGIKMSDPKEEVYGTFDRHEGILIYSPIFPRFSEERDLIKFAREVYFTSLSFEDVMLREVDAAQEYKLHVDNYKTAKDVATYGSYVMESISRDEMINFINNPSEGEKIRNKALRY